MNNKNKKAIYLFPLALLASQVAYAGQHYVTGIEGVKAAAAPGPGTYYRGYAVSYSADDSDGLPPNSDVQVQALAHRFIWVTEHKVLDGDLIFEAILPMVSTDLNIANGAVKDKAFTLGDLFVGSVISWHGDSWDSLVGAGLWSPTGDHGQPADAGKGYSELMLTFGVNRYLNDSKDLSLSLLTRYEIADDKNVNDEFVAEWGLGKQLPNGLNIGLAGYDQWELQNGKAEKHAVGLEANYFWPSVMMGLSVAGYTEYSVTNNFKGNQLRASLTKVF